MLTPVDGAQDLDGQSNIGTGAESYPLDEATEVQGDAFGGLRGTEPFGRALKASVELTHAPLQRLREQDLVETASAVRHSARW